MEWVGPAVTIVAGVACIGAWFCFWILDKKSLPRVCQLLMLTGATGVLSAAFARPVRHVMATVNRFLVHLAVQYVAAALVSMGFAVLVFYAGRAFVRKEIDDKVMVATALLPLVVPFIAGRIGDYATAIVYGPANAVGSIVAGLLGLI